MAEYFANVYKKPVSDFKQPLFRVKLNDTDGYLPSEFCLLDGVPDSFRKSFGMREALKSVRINPQ